LARRATTWSNARKILRLRSRSSTVSSAFEQTARDDLRANRLLALLAGTERARLAPHLTWLPLDAGTVLQAENTKPEHVYFPVSGIVANTLVMPEEQVTAAIIGNEGALFCDDSVSLGNSLTRATVRCAGAAWRMPLRAWQNLVPTSETAQVIAWYNALTVHETQQNAACCLLHDVESRLCRWILHIHDRLGRSAISMTHADLASLAGTRRTTVTLIAGALHTAGIIHTRRSRIEVADRFALEASACECYAAIAKRRAEFEQRVSANATVEAAQWPQALSAARIYGSG
jgi:CRP-like cAMP-binding protein